MSSKVIDPFDSAWETDWNMGNKKLRSHGVIITHTLSSTSSSKWLT